MALSFSHYNQIKSNFVVLPYFSILEIEILASVTHISPATQIDLNMYIALK